MGSKRNLSLALVISLVMLSHQSNEKDKFCPTHRMKHPTNCQLFFYCVNITKPQATHVWVPGKCQLGLVFQPVLGMCVIPEEYEACHGEIDTKITPEMVLELIKNQQQLLAEEPNLEFETPLEPTDKRQPTSSYFGDLVDHRINTNSRFSNIQDLNRYHSYQPTDGDKWTPTNKGINIKKPESISPTGSGYLNPQNYKIKGESSDESNPSYSMKSPYSTDYKWKDNTATRPSYLMQPLYQPNLDALSGYSKYYADSPSNMNTEQFSHKVEKSNYENTNVKTDDKHDHHKKPETKYQPNEANKNLPINQRDTENHTKSIPSAGISTPSQTQQLGTPSEKISNRQGGIQCRNRARQPHESDCTKYYTCSPKGNLTSYNCPYRTAFNAYTQKCDSKVYEDCLKQLDSGVRADTHFPLQDEIENTPPDETELGPQIENSQEAFKCSKEGKFTDTTSLQNYFMCSLDHGTQALTQHRLMCPQKLLFCPEKKICTHAEECYQ